MTAEIALPVGFEIARGWAADVRLQDVIAAIAWEQRTVRIFGRSMPQPRLTAWMGSGSYSYSGQRHAPAPMPAVVAALHARLGGDYNSVLANQYRDGRDSVAWHADDEPELGDAPRIASLSLGAPRVFQIRANGARYADRVEIVLAHGDLLVMSGASQRDYQHRVPKSPTPVGARVNLTFRHVA